MYHATYKDTAQANSKNSFRDIQIERPSGGAMPLKLIENGIICGFTSPAIDYIENDISLQELFIRNRSATFLGRIVGESLIRSGFEPGGIIFIDRSLEPRDGWIAICFIDGYFTAKKLKIEKDKNEIWLLPDCDGMTPVCVKPDDNLTIWGIVTWKCNPVI